MSRKAIAINGRAVLNLVAAAIVNVPTCDQSDNGNGILQLQQEKQQRDIPLDQSIRHQMGPDFGRFSPQQESQSARSFESNPNSLPYAISAQANQFTGAHHVHQSNAFHENQCPARSLQSNPLFSQNSSPHHGHQSNAFHESQFPARSLQSNPLFNQNSSPHHGSMSFAGSTQRNLVNPSHPRSLHSYNEAKFAPGSIQLFNQSYSPHHESRSSPTESLQGNSSCNKRPGNDDISYPKPKRQKTIGREDVSANFTDQRQANGFDYNDVYQHPISNHRHDNSCETFPHQEGNSCQLPATIQPTDVHDGSCNKRPGNDDLSSLQPQSNRLKKHDNVHHENHQFHWKSKAKTWNLYECSHSDSCKCQVKLRLHNDGKKEYYNCLQHNIECRTKTLGLCGQIFPGTGVVNCGVEARRLVKVKVHENFNKAAGDIADEVVAEMGSKYSTWAGITKGQLKTLAYNTKAEYKNGDIFRTIEQDAIRLTADGQSAFLQFNISQTDVESGGDLQRLIGLADPDLLKRMRGSRHLFLDATFKCTPKPFRQTLILMVFDEENGIFLPVMWILMTGQSEKEYEQALFNVKLKMNGKMNPLSITCDFEQAMMNALDSQFVQQGSPLGNGGKTLIHGCLFHQKQANRKKAEELGIPEDQRKYAMRRTVIDILSVIPKEEVITFGIPFLQSEISKRFPNMSNEDKLKWDKFWAYFSEHWVQRTKRFNAWHLHDDNGNIKDLHGKTNNGLERYNRHMNELFPGNHPTLLSFLAGIKNEAASQKDRLKRMFENHEFPPCYDDVYIPQVPDEYHVFKESRPGLRPPPRTPIRYRTMMPP